MKHLLCLLLLSLSFAARADAPALTFAVRSAKNGAWSDPKTWQPARVPQAGDRVLISRGTRVSYDVKSAAVLRLVQVAGALVFARDCDTELNAAIIKVQDSEHCAEHGFACDAHGAALIPDAATPRPAKDMATLEVGTLNAPIPAAHTARIRLHYLEELAKDDAPALVCCAGRMDLHGAPMNRTWVKLGKTVAAGDSRVTLAEAVTGWRVGDQVIVTATKKGDHRRSFRKEPDSVSTEERTIRRIEGNVLELDSPLKHAHAGEGDFRGEIANLSRNVIVESADPDGHRGHTIYHRHSRGGISYARFAHLGKEGLLGRYAIHFHLVGDTMRGSAVLGAAIVDSHNRWVTVHGTQQLMVRDCVGYRSVGHGYFLEDATEMYNLFDRNLGVQAFRGKRLPEQVLPFDPNDGAAFWWSNGRNTFVRNVAVENDEYGYRFDIQKRSNFDSRLSVLMPDGRKQVVDVRTLAISRFEANESHSEGLYSIALAGTDGVGPDTRHPHLLRGLKLWETHYAFRAELPTMLAEDVRIHRAAYGIYRPWFDHHVYRNLHISRTGTEPFNRGMDDDSRQHGPIAVDGLTFSELTYGGQMPLLQISDNNHDGSAITHLRNVRVQGRTHDNRWPLVNLGGGPRPQPTTATGVPVIVHDHYGPGRHAKVASVKAKDILSDGNTYSAKPPLTGDESVAAEVTNVAFPKLLDPVDDLPPTTFITRVARQGSQMILSGVSHDNGVIKEIKVNGQPAKIITQAHGVADWQITLPIPADGRFTGGATDDAGNAELTPHRLALSDLPNFAP
ncbi:MAG: hypothetical protein EXS22_04220 [Pedosphaera sp.]|nr:hypothetical protein [Pedosphaera sp.]